MIGIGLPIIYPSFNTGDAPVAPTKQVLYESDFTSDVDGWTDVQGLGGLSSGETSNSGLTDTLEYVSAAPFPGSRFIRLDLSSLTIPATATDYTVKFSFEGIIPIRVKAKFDFVSGTSTDIVLANTASTYEDTITATNPTLLDIEFISSDSSYTETAFFKNIELFYYA